MTRVKICGMTNTEDIQFASTVGTDAIGVICDVPVDTPRSVSVEQARVLLESVPPFVTSVLVIMPESARDAIDYFVQVQPDILQIYGLTTPSALTAIITATDASLLVAIDNTALETARELDGIVDGFLVDSIDTDGAGGTGETHDWEKTNTLRESLDSPVIVAGGLTPTNVSDAIEAVNPFGVDVASGVESTGGKKDNKLITSFIDQVRAVHSSTEVRLS